MPLIKMSYCVRELCSYLHLPHNVFQWEVGSDAISRSPGMRYPLLQLNVPCLCHILHVYLFAFLVLAHTAKKTTCQ